ncbi:MAG: leucine-rich repeat domain-containing protein [Bacteroidaceae bacterium]|nr:leucine-rich repeat domain-containing protein [Bacteroidaceae bacterium]
MKRILTLLAFVALTITANAVIQSGSCGANVTFVLNDDGTLVISGSGEMGNYAFSFSVPWDNNRSKIIKVQIEDGVTNIGVNAFYNCSALTSVTIPNSVTSIGEKAFYWCSGLTSVTIGNSVTSIGYEAFYGCSGLTSVTIPNSVTSIGGAAFEWCSGLTSITIPNSVTSIRYKAFHGCSGLTSVTIPNSVTSIGDAAFANCSGLTSVTIPNSVTSIGSDAFSYCSDLTSITIPNSVTSIGERAFSNCSGLSSITIPNSVKSIGDWAFSYCYGLTSIMVEKGNPNYDSRDNCNAIIETSTNTLISGCQNTIIPNSVTSIGYAAFSQCSGLTSIAIPNSVTSIGYMAFLDCTGLTSVTIPNSVTSIRGYAFAGCSGLKEIHSQAITPPTAYDSGTFYGVNKDDCKLYVPKGTKEAYASAEVWKEFINIIDGNDSDDEDVDALKARISALESEISTLKETIKKYAEGDLNLDGRTDIDDVVYLLKLDSYSSDDDALALLLDGTTAITLSDISNKYGDVEFYTLNGVKVDVPTKSGIYVVKKNGETKMVVVKK